MDFVENQILKDTDGANALQTIDVWVCSFGGCGSNMIAEYLNRKGKKVYCHAWHLQMCHHPYPIKPLNNPNLKCIYIYSDPIDAIKSQKRRDLLSTNYQKLNNAKDVPYGGHMQMLSSMERQYNNWVEAASSNSELKIMTINYAYVHDSETIKALGEFLNIDTTDFPKRMNRTSMSLNLENEECLRSLNAQFIERINNSPPFTINIDK